MQSGDDVDLALFRRRLAPLLSEDRLAAAAADGRLRAAQLQFARDARQHFGSDGQRRIGFAKFCVGVGKSLCAAMAVLGLLSQPRGTRGRVLLLAPTDAARHNLAELLRPSATAPADGLLVRALGLDVADAVLLSERTLVHEGEGVESQLFRRSWAIVTTPQMLARQADSLRAADFSACVVDEGDLGTLKTPHSTERSWYRIIERLLPSSHVLLLSATSDRPDGLPLPVPFSVYPYRRALEDGLVKSIKVVYLIPPYVSIARQDGRPPLDVSAALTAEQASIVSSDLECMRQVVSAGLEIFLEHRQRDGIPWVLHVVAARASLIPSLVRVVQEELDRRHPDPRMRATAVFSGMSPAERAESKTSLVEGRADAVVTCKCFERAVSSALICVTLNLKRFAKMDGKDKYVQCIVGRSVRVLTDAPELLAHRQCDALRRRLRGGELPAPQECVIIEFEPFDNKPLVLAFAAEQSAPLRELRRPLPAPLQARGGGWARARPGYPLLPDEPITPAPVGDRPAPSAVLQTAVRRLKRRRPSIPETVPGRLARLVTRLEGDHFVVEAGEPETAAVARQVLAWNALARLAAKHRIEFFESVRAAPSPSFTAKEVARAIYRLHGPRYGPGARPVLERTISRLLWVADTVEPDDRIVRFRDDAGRACYRYWGL